MTYFKKTRLYSLAHSVDLTLLGVQSTLSFNSTTLLGDSTVVCTYLF